MKTTIFIPTYNRPKELKRLLVFLKELKNPFPIVIADGSEPEAQRENAKTAEAFSNVEIHQYPSDLHLGIRFARGLGHVKTEYVCLFGDDDLVIPDGIRQCEDFLEKNPDYSFAIGRVRALGYSNRPILNKGFYFYDDLDYVFHLGQSTFIERMIRAFAYTEAGCPPIFYGLRRTEHAREIFDLSVDTLKFTSLELLSNAITLLRGKGQALRCWYGFRDYASQPLRQDIREDVATYFNQKDLDYIRTVLRPKLIETEGHSEEVADYLLSTFLTLRQQLPAEHAPGKADPLKWDGFQPQMRRVLHSSISICSKDAAAKITGLDSEVVRAISVAQRALSKR
jgi:glycosyltransferase domain-containing protein